MRLIATANLAILSDCTTLNLMMGADLLYPRGFHPIMDKRVFDLRTSRARSNTSGTRSAMQSGLRLGVQCVVFVVLDSSSRVPSFG